MRRTKKILTTEDIFEDREIKAMIKHLDSLRENLTNVTTKFYIELCHYCGLRVSEACLLTWNDIAVTGDGKSGSIQIRSGKGDKPREVFIGETGVKLINNHKKNLESLGIDTLKRIKGNTEYRGYDKNGKKIKVEFPAARYMFISKKGGRLTSSRMNHRFKDLMRDLQNLGKIRKASFSTHNLRHTFATNCLDKGMKLHSLRDQLGHTNIGITNQYLHLTKKAKITIQEIMG